MTVVWAWSMCISVADLLYFFLQVTPPHIPTNHTWAEAGRWHEHETLLFTACVGQLPPLFICCRLALSPQASQAWA